MGSSGVRTDLADFVHGRTAELHRTAYLLTADQNHAEHLVAAALRTITRHTDLNQAGTTLRHTMAHLAASADTPTTPDPTRAPRDPSQHTLATLTPRQRAILTLRTIDGLPPRETAKVLHLPQREVNAAEKAALEQLRLPADDAGLRALLDDFGEHATWPDPHETLEAVALKPARARPRRSVRTYAAAGLVVVMTLATVVISQVRHDSWLRTPSGINASHGTHFPAYSAGYELVDVRTLHRNTRLRLNLKDDQTLTVGCTGSLADKAPRNLLDFFDPGTEENSAISVTSSAASDDDLGCSLQRAGLSGQMGNVVTGSVVLFGTEGSRTWPVAIYRKVPWGRYPVATSGFQVEHESLSDMRDQTDDDGNPVRALRPGTVLTLRSGTKINGTFSGVLHLPRRVASSQVVLAGVLQPTTTGRFKVTLTGTQLFATCGFGLVSAGDWCNVYDKGVRPLVVGAEGMSDREVFGSDRTSVPVTVQVRDARGPWSLKVVADRYKVDSKGNVTKP